MTPTEKIDTARLEHDLKRLFARKTFGIKLGLEPVTRLLELIGRPDRTLPIVHVAGTNGKGSVCAMIASILDAAGLTVGLYSSPHLVDFRERMRVGGEPISRERLARYAEEMMPLIEETESTFFEGTTAIALRYFADEEVDVVVLETGMGGRLDATNVVDPLISVITSIGLDHTRHLGSTYEEIAREKGGIIKPDRPVVVGPVRPRLRKIFDEIAGERGTEVAYVEERVRSLHHETTLEHTVASFVTPNGELPEVRIDLPGKHQIANARVALSAVALLSEQFSVTEEAIVEGLGTIRGRTGIAGRFQSLPGTPTLLLEVAHNRDGVEVLIETLQEALPEGKRVNLLFGAVREKSTDEVMELLAPLVDQLYAVSAESERSLPSDEIAHAGECAGIAVHDCGSVEHGVSRALADAGPDDVVLICGSFFVVGEAVQALRKHGRIPGEDGPFGGEEIGERSREYHASNLTDEQSDGEQKEMQKEGSHRSVKDWDPSEQPRERLRALGPSALSDAELIAILLRTGVRSRDVVQVARDLLHAFSDRVTDDRLVDITGRDLKELEKVGGIGPVKATTLAAAFELGNRVVARAFSERPVVGSPENVARYFIPRFRASKKEEFHVILLNTSGGIIRYDRVSVGNLNSSIVSPREVFRAAIVEGAASIIGLHNHPSGNPEPSREDIAVTRQLAEAGRILGIPLRDHIIIAGEGYTSLADRGVI